MTETCLRVSPVSVTSDGKIEVAVSVGALAEFSRTGDINFGLSGHSSALEGIRAHQLVQASRGDGYRAEQTLSLRVEYERYVVSVHGRADGVDMTSRPVVLEEIKTLRVPVASVSNDMHSKQLRLYGHLLVAEANITSVLLRLCYYNLDTKEETLLDEFATAEDLSSVFEDTLNLFVDGLENKRKWSRTRNRAISNMEFPYDGFRDGQRDLSVAVYRSVSADGQLVLQAPTGTGKTMGTLYPTIKAFREERFDHVFYVSAKTSGQLAAESAIRDLHANGLKLRQVTITAKQKTCFNPERPCHPDHCSFAKGYYDRVRPAVAEVFASDLNLNRGKIESRAREFHLCPFELSLDLAIMADVIICDYNYVFDPVVYLRRFFEASSRCAVLVDESHNLVDRGRAMFSAALNKRDFLQLRKTGANVAKVLTVRLGAVNREILALRKNQEEKFECEGFLRLDCVPQRLIRSLRQFCEASEVFLRDNGADQEKLLSTYFDVLRFVGIAEKFDDTYAFVVLRRGKDIQLQLYNINPAPQLKLAFDRMTSAVCFSATLRPQIYHQCLLGIGEDATWYGLPSPFASCNVPLSLRETIPI